MAHDVFISHSSNNRPIANAVCAALESAGIRCWIAPRDVMPGRSYSGEITCAIQQSRVFILIFSEHSKYWRRCSPMNAIRDALGHSGDRPNPHGMGPGAKERWPENYSLELDDVSGSCALLPESEAGVASA